MSKSRKFLVLAIGIIVILNLLACNIETDMDRAWMTSTVQAAIVENH